MATSPLDGDMDTDVVVVGGGVSGALVTDALLRAGHRVVVLDRRGLVKGSTPASTALLQFDLDKPLTHLVRSIGRARAVRAYWRSATAVDALRRRVLELGLRCSFRERDSVYLPGDLLDPSALRREADARASVGLSSRFIDADELHALTGVRRRGAIHSTGAGELDPAALVAGLWHSAAARGALLHAPAQVDDIADGPRHVTLTTGEGHRVRARYAVFATGYELVKLVKPRGYRVISTWAIATRPQPERLWAGRCLLWEASDPYLYVRTTLDGRVIAGGEDEEFADEARRDALIAKKTAAIRRKLHELLPRLDTTPAQRWAGCFGQSATGMPAIGPIPGHPRCIAALGYGGNGITFSMIAAQLIQRTVSGDTDPDAALFAIGR